MSVTGKTLGAVTQTYPTLQDGDLFFVERASTAGKTTYSELRTELIGDIAKTGVDADVVTGTAGTNGHYATWNGDGDLVGGGGKVGMEFIVTKTASSSAALDFTELDSARYDGYAFQINNLRPVSDGVVPIMRISDDGGASYDSGASDYSWANIVRAENAGSSLLSDGDSAESAIILLNGLNGNAAGEDMSGWVYLINPHTARKTKATWALSATANDGVDTFVTGSGTRKTAQADNAVRFLFNTGNISSGSITMFGLRKA